MLSPDTTQTHHPIPITTHQVIDFASMWSERAHGIRAEDWWPSVTSWTLAFIGANLVTLLGASVWMIIEVASGSGGRMSDCGGTSELSEVGTALWNMTTNATNATNATGS